MPRVIALVAVVALTVWCLVDIVGHQQPSPRGLPKALWVLVVLVIPVLGPLVWLATGRAERRGAGQEGWRGGSVGGPSGGPRGGSRGGPAGGSAGGPRRQPPRRPMGPDDDPDFLRGL